MIAAANDGTPKERSPKYLAKITTALITAAMWCGPCKALTPRLTTLSSKYPDITFVKVDVDENMDAIGELEIRSVPTIMIYNGDTLVNRSTGANIDSVYTKILDTL